MTDNLDLNILKAIVTDKKIAIEFVSNEDTKLFSSEVYNFSNILVNYIKNYKELPTERTLLDKIKNNLVLENAKKIWTEISNHNYDLKEYKYDLEKIKNRFAVKQLSALKDLAVKSDLDIVKSLGDAQKILKSINSLSSKHTFDSRSIKDHLPVFVERFNAKKENPSVDQGLKTYYDFFDFATNGVKPADFILIAGESGFGKSLLLNNFAVQTWLQSTSIDSPGQIGKNVIYFSLEMPYDDCFMRFLARLSGVPSRNIENSRLSKEEFAKVKKALDFIKTYPYDFKIVDIADASANDIENILLESDKNYDAVFIDYIGIMKPNNEGGDQDWLTQGIISAETRSIARRLTLPIFSAVQLNRKTPGKESSDNIGLNRLARSATIATHATHVLQIESRNQEHNHPDMLVHIIKNRKGPKLKGTLLKDLSSASLLNINDESFENGFNSYNDYFDDISDEFLKLEL